jgi:hypothetical protein
VRVNADLEIAIDAALPGGCGGCGRSLPEPGVQCPECQAWPDITRQEARAFLAQPGELSMHRAGAAEREAVRLMKEFTDAAAVPDRHRKVAEIEQQQAEVQQALADTGREHSAALSRLAEAQEAQESPAADLEEALAVCREAAAALEKAERTLAGPRAEADARMQIAMAAVTLEKFQRLHGQAAARTESARLDVERAELMVSMAEAARDEQAARLLHVGEVRPSASRLKLLAHPLVAYLAELADDQAAENPQYQGEWGNAMALVHTLAGVLGLLAMAEEGATPRVLGELTGPLSRAQDVAAIERRLAGSRVALPPGPGEASVTLVRNTIT